MSIAILLQGSVALSQANWQDRLIRVFEILLHHVHRVCLGRVSREGFALSDALDQITVFIAEVVQSLD